MGEKAELIGKRKVKEVVSPWELADLFKRSLCEYTSLTKDHNFITSLSHQGIISRNDYGIEFLAGKEVGDGAMGIAIQHILYDKADCALLESALPQHVLTDPALQILFVLGRHTPNSTAHPDELAPFMHWLTERQINPDWAVCAFGATETECLSKGAALGGKRRVGFENSRILGSGAVAKDNAQKVMDLKEALLSVCDTHLV